MYVHCLYCHSVSLRGMDRRANTLLHKVNRLALIVCVSCGNIVMRAKCVCVWGGGGGVYVCV